MEAHMQELNRQKQQILYNDYQWAMAEKEFKKKMQRQEELMHG